MKKAYVLVNNHIAGEFIELERDKYQFHYFPDYQGAPVSLTMPVAIRTFEFKQFPPFFDGLLPEGAMLEALCRKFKLDKQDYFGQLMQVGNDVVGAVTIKEMI